MAPKIQSIEVDEQFEIDEKFEDESDTEFDNDSDHKPREDPKKLTKEKKPKQAKQPKKQKNEMFEDESDDDEIENKNKKINYNSDDNSDDNSDHNEKGKKQKRGESGPVSMTLIKKMTAKYGDDLPEMDPKQLKIICDALIKTIVTEVMDGNNVTLMNHMSFKRVKRAARTHRIPKSTEVITKPAHFVMTMDVKPALKKTFTEIDVDDE